MCNGYDYSKELTSMFVEYNELVNKLGVEKMNNILDLIERHVECDTMLEELRSKRLDNDMKELYIDNYDEECDDCCHDEHYLDELDEDDYCEDCGEELDECICEEEDEPRIEECFCKNCR
jgi:alpha-D-ribose 1-methylphosphonate 5-phosphate C-P lyase